MNAAGTSQPTARRTNGKSRHPGDANSARLQRNNTRKPNTTPELRRNSDITSDYPARTPSPSLARLAQRRSVSTNVVCRKQSIVELLLGCQIVRLPLCPVVPTRFAQSAASTCSHSSFAGEKSARPACCFPHSLLSWLRRKVILPQPTHLITSCESVRSAWQPCQTGLRVSMS